MTKSPDVVKTVEEALGRPVTVNIGGLSHKQIMALHDQTVASIAAAAKPLGRLPISEVIPDLKQGRVKVTINTADFQATDLQIPAGVTTDLVADLKAYPAASFAGVEYEPSCTVGYMARDFLNNNKYVVTAAHCPDLPATAYGSSLTDLFSETCQTIDTQALRTSATYVWYGFYNAYNQWSTIHAVAGGWYDGQPFHRRGRNTIAVGTIQNPTTITVGGGDCGSYQVYAFPLINTFGPPSGSVVGGDSGGPMMLVYFNQYYLAGITTSVGIVSNGRSAWRSVPPGLAACTAQIAC